MRMHIAASITALLLVWICSGCSPDSGDGQSKKAKNHQVAEDPTAALARKYGCSMLGAELQKMVGTNPVYSLDVQRFLATNKRFVALCTLVDLVQSGQRVEAVFDVQDIEIVSLSGQCLLRLDCPTNFVPVLASEE